MSKINYAILNKTLETPYNDFEISETCDECINISYNSGEDDFITFPINQIDELIEMLNEAKKLL